MPVVSGPWYEITATYSDPNSVASKPNIPYPLPKPDGSTGCTCHGRTDEHVHAAASNPSVPPCNGALDCRNNP